MLLFRADCTTVAHCANICIRNQSVNGAYQPDRDRALCESESAADSSSRDSQITAYKSFAPKTLIALVHLKAHTLTHTHSVH